MVGSDEMESLQLKNTVAGAVFGFQVRSRFFQPIIDTVRLRLAVTTWSRCSLRTQLLEQLLVPATKQIPPNQY